MKKFYLLLFTILISCATAKNVPCLTTNEFAINVSSGQLSRIAIKTLLNGLINNSSIYYNENSNYVINLNVSLSRSSLLMSINNTSEIDSVYLTARYEIIEKTDNIVIDKGKIIVIDDINISDNRFANYMSDEYVMHNVLGNLARQLENRIDMLKNNKKCIMK